MEERVQTATGDKSVYIVQIPKDRIFNVPPPEHADIVDRHQNEKKPNRGASNIFLTPHCFSYIFGVSMLIGVIVGIIIIVAHVIIQPKVPIISIKNLESNTLAEFDVTYAVKDDGKMSMSPNGNGEAHLMYKNTEIGSGRFSGVKIGSGQSKTGNLKVKGVKKDKLPAVVKTSMGDKKGKHPISVWLTMRIPVVMSASGVHTQNKEIDVNCNMSFSSLGAKNGLTSQRCKAKFS
ncbi:hypothetical protein LINGRAPRIM_LOCUS908 [Linum grandiflorum]